MSRLTCVGARMIAGWVFRSALRIGLSTAVSSGLGVLRQMTDNGITGKRWDDGLGEAAAMGALTGFLTGVKSEAVAFLKPIKGDGLRLKFWQNRNWKVYRLDGKSVWGMGQASAAKEFSPGLDFNAITTLSYKPIGEFSSSSMSFMQQTTRFLPIEHVTVL